MPDEAPQQPEPEAQEQLPDETDEGIGPDEPGELDEPEEPISWQASEFVHHHKSPLWYGVLGLIVFVLAAVAVWLHLWLEIGLFLAMGAAVVVYARKAPRTLLYELDGDGLTIDGKKYGFEDFRSFGVVEDTEWHSIDLEPSKRFSPRMVVLFDSSSLDEIVEHLERHLPRADREPDVIERITRYVRF
ncbi:MAG TPA: hypothetical protein VMT30_00530 [Candidatus Saccharimonadia bacterium]|nr:hypothetical protein [Candidatus Saccharimonadia bacterium]